MACCCGPQTCLCSTPPNGAKATQVLVEFLNFTCDGGASTVRPVWRDFANSTITNYLNGLSLYLSVLNPQPAGFPASMVAYGFSATYTPGYCEVSGVSMRTQFQCSNGAGTGLGSFSLGFRRDAEPQGTPLPGPPFINYTSRCGWCGNAFTPDTCDGSRTFGDGFPAPAGNVCTMAQGTSSGVAFQMVLGSGNNFDIAAYTGDIRYTPL